jgi:nucleotide-binding universal stress UspA family protein
MTDARMVGDVVVAVDFSDHTDALVAEGAALAKASGGELHLVHVAAGEPVLAGYDKDELSSHTRDARADELTDEHRRLREMGADAAAAGVVVKPLVVMGPTAQTILETAAHLGASHLVIGSHGHGGLHHLLVGSVAEEVVRQATMAVVLIPIRSGR